VSYQFSKQFISFEDSGPLGDTKITIETPSLTDAPAKVYGDWGPNCVFNIDPKDPLKVYYTQNDHKELSVIELNTIEFKSPMLGEQRSIFPFYLEFSDTKTNYKFKVYYDHNGQARQVEFDRKKPAAVTVCA
jgi:hypothetical protein